MPNELSWKEYRGLKLRDIFCPRYRHLLLLLYLPFQCLAFFTLERVYPSEAYTVISCAWDQKIPFCELFVIPYVLWFPFWFGMVAFTLRYDIAVYKKLMWYTILCCGCSLIVFAVFPNRVQLRPELFPRDNVFTRLVGLIYSVDDSSNACPSDHVIVALGLIFTVLHCRRLSRPAAAIPLVVLGLLICASVAFIKQHSVLDALAALPLSLIGYLVCFRRKADS
jgi:membrane-associated phospholipid phosphatase